MLKNAADLAEILGVFVFIIGAGLCVAAASILSTAAALLVAGGFCLFAAVVIIFVASSFPDDPKAVTRP